MQARLLLKTGIALLLCGCFTQSYAQWEPALFFNVGYASYSAKDMKEQNKSIQKIYPEVKIVSNYPAYITYSGGVSMLIDKKLYFTVFGGHSSTGSRVSYGDYSGHIYQDNLVRTSTLGASGAFSFWRRNGYSLFLGLRSAANLNTLKIVSEVQTGTDYEHQEHDLESATFSIEPHFMFMKTIGRFVGRVEAGYDVQIPGQWHLPGDRNAVLINTDTNETMRYNGSGFRLNAGISFLLMAPNRDDL